MDDVVEGEMLMRGDDVSLHHHLSAEALVLLLCKLQKKHNRQHAQVCTGEGRERGAESESVIAG